MKGDLLFVIERLVLAVDENRIEMLARQHGIRQKRDDGGVKRSFASFVRRADEGTTFPAAGGAGGLGWGSLVLMTG